MNDEVWRRQEIDSPCVKLCVLHPDAGLCVGCHRTVDEIAAWSSMSPEARSAVMDDLPRRAPLVAPRRKGGRSARLAALTRGKAP